MSQPVGATAPRPAAARGAVATAPPPAMPARVPAGAPGGPAAYRSGAPAKSRVGAWVRGQVAGTPGRMRLLGAGASIAALLFGLVGAGTLWASAGSVDRASANTEQVVRVQSIYADVLRADADATNAFLVGGNEDPQQRADYESTMKRVAGAVAVAAREQAADGAALAELNSELQSYAALIEQARAYNRQGLPVGAQYQTQASDRLRTNAVPIIQSLLQANTGRAELEFGSASTRAPVLLVGLAALLVFVVVGLWLARRTRRYVNVGLTAGAATVLAALVGALVVLGSVGDDVRRVADNQFAGTVALTTARSAAYDAKANESLGLIARGQANVKREKDVQASLLSVSTQLGKLSKVRWFGPSGDAVQLEAIWGDFREAHVKVRALDDAGTWDEAVALATSPTSGTRPTFAKFEQASSAALAGYESALVSDVVAPATKARITAALVLLAGLLAGVLVTRGVAQRVEEYR